MMQNTVDRELGWDDEISKESEDFIVLPAGDYNFSISSFERARHPGSEKLPPCNKAVVTVRIETDQGVASIRHNLFLHTKTEGMISNFFEGIGLKKKGEPIRMDWNRVIGQTGRCRVSVHNYKNKDGEDRQSNNITKFYPKDNKPAFTPGSF